MNGPDTQRLVSATLLNDDEQTILVLRLGPQALSFTAALDTQAEILAEIERSLPRSTGGGRLVPAAILDLRDVPDLGSYGDGILVRVFNRLVQAHGAGLVLAGASKSIRDFLALCRLDQIFPVCPDVVVAVAEARAHLRILAAGPCHPAFAMQVAAINKRRWQLAGSPVAPPESGLH